MFRLEAYDPTSDELIREVPIRAVSIEALRRIFRAGPQEHFVDLWPVDQAIAQDLAVLLDEPLAMQDYVWFLTRESSDAREHLWNSFGGSCVNR
jgi:hypothetical protein